METNASGRDLSPRVKIPDGLMTQRTLLRMQTRSHDGTSGPTRAGSYTATAVGTCRGLHHLRNTPPVRPLAAQLVLAVRSGSDGGRKMSRRVSLIHRGWRAVDVSITAAHTSLRICVGPSVRPSVGRSVSLGLI